MKVAELKQFFRDNNVKGYSSWRKAELLENYNLLTKKKLTTTRTTTTTTLHSQVKILETKESITEALPQIFLNLKECFPKIDDFEYAGIHIVTISQGAIIGNLIIQRDGSIWSVCVSKKFRKQGIGRQLMLTAIEYVKSKNLIPVVFLDVADGENFKKLVKFYKKLGFKKQEQDEDSLKMAVLN